MALLINPATKAAIEQALAQNSGSYLITGAEGCGKYFVVSQLAAALLSHQQYSLPVQAAKDSIGITQIKDLRHQLQLKTAAANRRVVLIRDADKMTREAQNAFLKTLEEPPVGVLIFLTTSKRPALLPTILSRVKEIQFRPVTPKQITRFLIKEYGLDNTQVEQISSLSGQALGRAVELASEPEKLAAAKQTQAVAAQVLDSHLSTYQRFAALNSQYEQLKPKQILVELISQLQLQVRDEAKSANIKQLSRLNKKVQHYHQLLRYLEANGNPKLALNQIILST